MSDLHDDIFAISPDIRYVASAHGQAVQMRSRPDLHNASSTDSDLYEELLVNPTLLTLATQRGNIDCGGLRYLIVGYGHFNMLVIPVVPGTSALALSSPPTRSVTCKRSWVSWRITASPRADGYRIGQPRTEKTRPDPPDESRLVC